MSEIKREIINVEIVRQLRSHGTILGKLAADKIERLEAENARLRDELKLLLDYWIDAEALALAIAAERKGGGG